MSGGWRRFVVLLGVLSLLAVPLTAVADEGVGDDGTEEESSAPTDDSQLIHFYEDFFHLFIFGFQDPDADPADEPLDCTLLGDVDNPPVTVDAEGLVTIADGALPEGCTALNVEGPNGQVNHGSFVSAAVHAMKAAFEDFDGDLPFGQYIRQFAQGEFGKGEDQVKVSDGDDDGDVFGSTESDKGPKPKKSDGDDDDDDDDEFGSTESDNEPNSGNGRGRGKGKGKGKGKKNR